MKILIAIPQLHLHGDGLSHYALTLVQAIRQYGYTAWLAHANPLHPKEASSNILAGLQEQQQLRLIPFNQFEKTALNTIKTMYQLRQLMCQEQLTLIHSLHRWPTFLTQWTRWGLPTKLVTTDQNILLGKRHFSLWGDHVISVSEAGKRHLINYFGVSATKISVIHNATQVTPAKPTAVQQVRQQFQLGDDALVLVNVARLDKQKGHVYLLRAMPALVARWPRLHLLLVGSGPLAHELQQLVNDLQLEEYVTFTGLRQDVPAILANASLFVLSSLWEGLPFAMLEAMFLGVPVVATAVGGVAEVIIDQKTGWLVQPGDVLALQNAINLALANEVVRNKMARNGQKKVQHQFSKDRMVEQTLAVYNHLCKP